MSELLKGGLYLENSSLVWSYRSKGISCILKVKIKLRHPDTSSSVCYRWGKTKEEYQKQNSLLLESNTLITQTEISFPFSGHWDRTGSIENQTQQTYWVRKHAPKVSVWSIPREAMPQTIGFSICMAHHQSSWSSKFIHACNISKKNAKKKVFWKKKAIYLLSKING